MRYLGVGFLVAAMSLFGDIILFGDGKPEITKRFGQGSLVPTFCGLAIPAILAGAGIQLLFWKRKT